jgi:hypothetical protein
MHKEQRRLKSVVVLRVVEAIELNQLRRVYLKGLEKGLLRDDTWGLETDPINNNIINLNGAISSRGSLSHLIAFSVMAPTRPSNIERRKWRSECREKLSKHIRKIKHA